MVLTSHFFKDQGLYESRREHDACGIGAIANISGERTHAIIEYGKQAGWMHLELRGGMSYLEKSTASATFVSHSLDLSGDEQQIFKSFRDSTRRNIKKAAESNLQVTLDNSWQSAMLGKREIDRTVRSTL